MKVGSGTDPYEEEIEDETAENDTEEAPDAPGKSLPWIFTRENVKSDRSMVQFYLRDEVKDQEEDFVDALEDELDTSVSTTDAREAAYLAAMKKPEAVAKELREWGFDLKD